MEAALARYRSHENRYGYRITSAVSYVVILWVFFFYSVKCLFFWGEGCFSFYNCFVHGS